MNILRVAVVAAGVTAKNRYDLARGAQDLLNWSLNAGDPRVTDTECLFAIDQAVSSGLLGIFNRKYSATPDGLKLLQSFQSFSNRITNISP